MHDLVAQNAELRAMVAPTLQLDTLDAAERDAAVTQRMAEVGVQLMNAVSQRKIHVYGRTPSPVRASPRCSARAARVAARALALRRSRAHARLHARGCTQVPPPQRTPPESGADATERARDLAAVAPLLEHVRNFQAQNALSWPDALAGAELEAVRHLPPAAQCSLGALARAFTRADARGVAADADTALDYNSALLDMKRTDFDAFRDKIREAIASEADAAKSCVPQGAAGDIVSFDTRFHCGGGDPKLQRAWARVKLADGRVAEG